MHSTVGIEASELPTLDYRWSELVFSLSPLCVSTVPYLSMYDGFGIFIQAPTLIDAWDEKTWRGLFLPLFMTVMLFPASCCKRRKEKEQKAPTNHPRGKGFNMGGRCNSKGCRVVR